MTYVIATPLLVLACAQASFGAEGLLQCEDHGNTHVRCRTQMTELYPRQDFHAEVSIDYDFDCRGHAISSQFASESEVQAVLFGGSGAQPLRLEGYGPFVLQDKTPTVTYAATLLGRCELKLKGPAKLRPSQQSLIQWKTEASDLATMIGDTLNQLKLTKSLGEVISWDDEQITTTLASVTDELRRKLPATLAYESLIYPQDHADIAKRGKLKDAADMPAAWPLAVIRNRDLPYLVALGAQLEAVAQGRPPIYGPGDEAALRQELEARVARAQRIIDRAERWISVIDQDLKDLAAELKRLRDVSQNQWGDEP